MKLNTIDLEGGKYRIFSGDGRLFAFRHGEEWRDLVGDKLVGAMFDEIERLRGIVEEHAPHRLEEQAGAVDTCSLMGMRADGSTVNLGTAPMPPLMKARDVVRSYFGGDPDDEMSDASMALQCCREVIEHMNKAAKS